MLTLLISLDILSPSLHPPTYPHTHTPAHTLTHTRTQIHTHFQNCQDVFCIFILLNLLHKSKMVWLKPLVKYIIYICVCVCVCVYVRIRKCVSWKCISFSKQVEQVNQTCIPIAFRRSRLHIPATEIIIPRTIVSFEKTHPGQFFLEDTGTKRFLTC